MVRRADGGAVDWLPRPNKDIDYYTDLSAEADRIRREIDGPRNRPRLFRRADWPKQRPLLDQARVGDALVGHVELRASCACGHSAPVEARAVAAKFEATTRLADIRRKVRCTQCRRYGTLTAAWPEEPR
jgi:hypothetical protein